MDGRREFFEAMNRILHLQEGSLALETPALEDTTISLCQRSFVPFEVLAGRIRAMFLIVLVDGAADAASIGRACRNWDMEITEEEPIRLENPGPYQRSELPLIREMPLPRPQELRGSLFTALAKRRSAHAFTPIDIQELSTWLHYTASIQAINSEDRNRQQRFVASFGALHPTHIVLGGPDDNWTAYIPAKRVLGELRVDATTAASLQVRAREYFSTENATLIVLLSDADLVNHYYLHPRSLMLRDAGVLLGHGSLVAAALGLGFRILGGTGTPLVEKLVRDLPFRPAATGLAWIGGAGAA